MPMSVAKFESMLKTNDVYFFDANEFEIIIQHYLTVGKHSLAKKAVRLGLDQHPGAICLKLLKTELLVFENHMKEAVELLTEIEAVEPHNEEVFIQKATILSKKKKHKEAILLLKKSLDYTDDPLDIWAMMGMEYLYMDDFDNARLNFAKCIDVDYEDYSSLYNIIYCFEMQENYEEAVKFLNSFIDNNPYCEIAWHQLGRQYYELGMFKEALTAFDYSVIIDETFIGGYLEKAKVLEEIECYEEAIENYLVTLELDDPTAYAYTRIGECFEKLELYDNAIQYYKKAINEDPVLDKPWLLLANVYFRDENYQKAIYYINKAIEIDDANPVFWRKYGEINIKLNFYEEAVKAFERCIDLGDIAIEIYVALSDVLFFLGEVDDALAIMIRAKNDYKDFAEVEYRLFGLFHLVNKKDVALTHLKNALAIDFDYHSIIKDVFPSVFDVPSAKKIIADFKKATE